MRRDEKTSMFVDQMIQMPKARVFGSIDNLALLIPTYSRQYGDGRVTGESGEK